MKISPTLSLAEAVRRFWDVVVVGAGPAGALAAHELARLGAAVLLVDRSSFPRGKVCGCCLNLRSVRTLSDVGLEGILSRNGAIPLRELQLFTHGLQSTLPLPGGVVLSRQALDAGLVAAAIAAGCPFLPGTQARGSSPEARSRVVHVLQGTHAANLDARVVVAADGLASRLVAGEPTLRCSIRPDSRIGAAVVIEEARSSWLPGTVYMACGRVGYLGLVRLEDGRLNAAAAVRPAAIRSAGGLGPLSQLLLREAGLEPETGLATGNWQGTPLLTRTLARPWAERLFILGDAAGYVEPFTGEGIAYALASAQALAPLALSAAQQWDERLGRQWAATHQAVVKQRQILLQLAAGILRRPLWTRLLVTLLAAVPALAQPFVSRLNRP